MPYRGRDEGSQARRALLWIVSQSESPVNRPVPGAAFAQLTRRHRRDFGSKGLPGVGPVANPPNSRHSSRSRGEDPGRSRPGASVTVLSSP